MQLPEIFNIGQHLHELDIFNELRIQFISLLSVVWVQLIFAILIVHVLAVGVLLEIVGILAVRHQLFTCDCI